MRKQHILGICLGVCLVLLGVSLFAQMVRPTHSSIRLGHEYPLLATEAISQCDAG